MRLSCIEQGQRFFYEGFIYTIDLLGRSGSGMVAIRKVSTGEALRMPASTTVTLVDKADEVEEQSIEDSFTAMLERDYHREVETDYGIEE